MSTYSTPEDLANQVEVAFTKLLNELYPEGTLSELEKERIGQRAYLNSLCQNYIRTEANFKAIEDWMTDWEKHQLVITGASGLGKSALVANWVKEKLIAGEGLPYRVIYHFVGNGGSLGSHGHVIKALCDEIRDRYGFNIDEKDDKTDEKTLEELFNRVAAEGDRPLLIVLDAINQIIDIDHSKRLNWLPIPPKKVKILFTTLEDDETMEVFKDRHYPLFTLQPLSREQRKLMVRGYLSIFSKKLQPYQVDRIVDDPQCQNTLVLKTLLDELVNFGVYEKLDMKIGTYLGSASVEDFYGILLKGYEVDFGEEFVKHTLSLIVVSRNGLSEDEILGITQETPLHWSQFFCAIRQHLVVKNGLISFAHSYIRKAVHNRYVFEQGEWERFCRVKIATTLKPSKTHRAMGEVPYQYDRLGDLKSLHDYLLDLEVFVYLNESERNTLGDYWRKLRCDNEYSLAEYLPLTDSVDDSRKVDILADLSTFSRTTVTDPPLSMVFIEKSLPFVKDEEERATVYVYLGHSFDLSGIYQKALEYQTKALSIDLSLFGENHPDVATDYSNVGGTYGELGDLQKELDYQVKALSIRQSLFEENHPDVATSYNNVGCTYEKLGEHQKALDYQIKALNTLLVLFGESHPDVASSYNNVGCTYGELGDYQKELDYLVKALNIRQALFGENHPDVATSYNNVGGTFGKLGDRPKALDYQMKALSIRQSLFGENHPDVADSYNNVGCTYGELGDYQKKLDYLVKALNIRQALFGENHPDVATSYNNVGCAYGELGDHNKALEYQKKALIIRLARFGESHPDVATSYNNVGCTYGELGDHQKALDYKVKALSISQSILGENHPNVATSYVNLGYTYGELEDYRKALECQKKALKIRLSLFGENHSDVATSYNIVGGIYGELGDHQKTLEYQIKALNILLVLYGESHPDVATSYNNVGYIYGELGDHQKALEYQKKALNTLLTLYGENHPDVATSYNNVGFDYGELGNYQKALEYQMKALEIRRSLYGKNDSYIAGSYDDIGYTYLQLEDYEKSIDNLLKGLIIAKMNNDLESVAYISSHIGSVYKTAGRLKIANKFFRQAAEKYRELGDNAQAEANLKEIIE